MPLLSSLAVLYREVRDVIEKHEKLFLVLIAAAIIWGVTGKVQDVIAKHDKANADAATVVLQAQVEKTNEVLALAQKQAEDYKALAAKVDAQNSALEQANVALATALTKQQKINDASTPTEIIGRWSVLVPEVSGGLSINNGTVQVSDKAAHATVNELEKVPTLTSELANEKLKEQGTQNLLDAANGRVGTLNTSVDNLKLQLTDAGNKCEADKKVLKDEARKGKRKWFVAGYSLGLATRGIIKLVLGI